MATIQQSLSIGTITDTTLTSIFTVGANTTVAPALVLTNITANKTTVSVTINNGVTDFLLVKKAIPAGIGKTFRVLEMSDLKLNSSYVVKLQLDTTDAINFFLAGSIIT